MQRRKWLSKLLAAALCLQMILAAAGQTGNVYAAEGTVTEAVLSEDTARDDPGEDKSKKETPESPESGTKAAESGTAASSVSQEEGAAAKSETAEPAQEAETKTEDLEETAESGDEEAGPGELKEKPTETEEEEERVESTGGSETVEETEKGVNAVPEDAQEKADEAAKVKWNTAPITGKKSKDGVIVRVSAPEGSFPEGTELRINAINASKTNDIARSIDVGQEAVAFDIYFVSSRGEKVQPREGYHVDVQFEISADSPLGDPDGKGAVLRAYHVGDGGKVENLGEEAAPEQGSAQMEIQANSFSPYIIIKETREEKNRAGRDAAVSTDLADFLVNVSFNAPTDENGNYIINPNETYELAFSFREKEDLQFDNEADLVYELPEGLIAPDVSSTSFDINIVDDEGSATVSGNTFEVADGRLIVRFNQSDPNIERLKALANVAFQAQISVRIKEDAGSVVFNSDIEKEFVFDTSADLTIDKAVSYNMDTDTADYVIRVTSYGHNENVQIQDVMTGTALSMNKDVTVESSIHGMLDVSVDYESVDNGFIVNVPGMDNNEVLTIRCSAAVDNTKISSNGTVEQTNNTARVTSDQVPDGKEASADFAGKVNFQKVTKRAAGEPVQLSDNLYEQTWTILVNEDHKLLMGGTNIYDWIVQNSRPYMVFSGDGITVRVTKENGETEERAVPWSDLHLWQNDNGIWGWGYLPPESDGKASYEIICTTLINSSGALGNLTLINGAQVNNSYNEGQTTVGVIGENVFGIQKEAVGTTPTESEWKITVTVPCAGLPELHIIDDCPKLEGHTNIDYFIEDSMEVDGLLDGESWKVESANEGRTFVVRFYKNGEQNAANSGVLPTPDGQPRDIVIRFKTQVDQEWLDMAAEDGYNSSTFYRHRNYARAWSGTYATQTVNASVIPLKPAFVKNFAERSEVEIDGVTYPVFRYSLSLSGLVEDGTVIHDRFDTQYLRFYEADGLDIRGGRSANALNNTNGTATAFSTSEGIDITVSSFPKNSDGNIYPYYRISYSLIVKDQEALAALNQEAADTQGGKNLDNTASWDDLESSRTVNYTYFPYVDKELVSAASADNDYVAEFKLIINRNAQDLDPTSDTLNIQDTLSANLRFVQDSLSVSPEAEGMTTRFDSETNTLVFTDVPDNTRFEITYRARVLGKGNVSYSNTVKFGSYEKTVEEEVQIDSSGSGSGSNPSITLIKRDSEDVSAALSGATFLLFYVNGDSQVPVTDKNGNQVSFTTGENGSVLIAGNQSTLGWTLWEGRTYRLVETEAPTGYELNETPTEFILSETPSSQMEYDLIGDSVTAWDTKVKTEIPVNKRWHGPAGQSVTVLLKAGDQTIQTATLNEENNWQYTFTGIDKYDSDGEVIEYKVEEEPLDGYTAEISGNPEGYTITNTSTETLDIPVEKKWVGPAADSVTIRLLADGQEKESIVLTEEGEWKHIFNDLPKYDRNDGHEIEYTVQEDPLENYVIGISGTASNGYTITNTITGKVSVPVTKIWVGKALDEVTIRLFADGSEAASHKLTAEENWKYVFEDLPRYDWEDSHEIEYTIIEDDITGYSSKVEGSAENGYTVTNTEEKTPEKTPEITPEKTPKNTTKKATKKTTRSSSSTRKTKSGNSPGTGDETNIAIWLGILLVSASILFFILRRQKKKKDTK